MNVLVVDDHQLFIDGIRYVLAELCHNTPFITEANRSDLAIAIMEQGQNFDLVLLDLAMPDMSGLSLMQRMHESGFWSPVVVVSGENNLRTIKSALDLGALGFIPKSFSGNQMLTALRAVLEGDTFLPDDIASQISALTARRTTRPGNLTKRQQQVLELIAQGYSNRAIADTLYLTEHTIKAHVSALFIELNARNRTECVQLAKGKGLITA